MFQLNKHQMMPYQGPKEWIHTVIISLNRPFPEINKIQCLLSTQVKMVEELDETNLRMKSRKRASFRHYSVMKVTVRWVKVILASPASGTTACLLMARRCPPRCARERNAGKLLTISCASTTIATWSRLSLSDSEECPALAASVDTSKVSQSAISTSVHSHLKMV